MATTRAGLKKAPPPLLAPRPNFSPYPPNVFRERKRGLERTDRVTCPRASSRVPPLIYGSGRRRSTGAFTTSPGGTGCGADLAAPLLPTLDKSQPGPPWGSSPRVGPGARRRSTLPRGPPLIWVPVAPWHRGLHGATGGEDRTRPTDDRPTTQTDTGLGPSDTAGENAMLASAAACVPARRSRRRSPARDPRCCLAQPVSADGPTTGPARLTRHPTQPLRTPYCAPPP